MLEACNVSYEIRGKHLLCDASLALKPGSVVGLIGPNGAGKSTMLRLFTGELTPTSGEMLIDGRRMSTLAAGELSRRRAVVAQSTPLSFPFTVLEVVLLGVTVPGFEISRPSAQAAALDALRTVGLARFEDRLYTELSGGERQRVHIARALCQLATAKRPHGETAALLLDEPTSSLDLAHQGMVLGEARRQSRMGRAVLAILHDLNLAAIYADVVVLLSRGRIVAMGTAMEVMRDDLLSEVYGCELRTNVTPANGAPFVLPSAPSLHA